MSQEALGKREQAQIAWKFQIGKKKRKKIEMCLDSLQLCRVYLGSFILKTLIAMIASVLCNYNLKAKPGSF